MNQTKSQSAFATITVIILLGLVTAALAALVSLSRSESKRTQSAITQAQLRQIAIAAIINSNSKAKTWGESPQAMQWTLNLPSVASSAHMEMASESINHLHVNLHGMVGNHRIDQLLHFQRVGPTWELVEIESESE